MRKTFPKGIYLITDNRAHHGVLTTVEAAAKAGVCAVQLRDKECSDADYIKLGLALKDILAPYNIPLILNDRVHLYHDIGAEGVHVGQGDLQSGKARETIGQSGFLGLSIGFAEELEACDWSDIDNIGIGPVYETNTKANHRPAIGVATFEKISSLAPVPTFAIGGIEPAHIEAIKQTGAGGVALISAICMAEDPYKAAKRLVDNWNEKS